MKRWFVTVCAALATSASGAEVELLSAGAAQHAFEAAAEQWRHASGHAVKASFGPVGELRKRLEGSATPDLVVVPSEAIDALASTGKLDLSTRRDLGVVSIGAAVREGARKPDISTPEALKRTLLEARSVTYMDPSRGTSGKFFDEKVLPALGIRDQVRAKATLGQGGFIAEKVASGEVDIAFHQITELLPVKGVTLVGPLPDPLQKRTTYTALLARSPRHPAEARSLLEFLVSPAGRQAFIEHGFAAPKD